MQYVHCNISSKHKGRALLHFLSVMLTDARTLRATYDHKILKTKKGDHVLLYYVPLKQYFHIFTAVLCFCTTFCTAGRSCSCLEPGPSPHTCGAGGKSAMECHDGRETFVEQMEKNNKLDESMNIANCITFVFLSFASIFDRQARVFTPPMFIAQEPQMPSLQLLLKFNQHQSWAPLMR